MPRRPKHGGGWRAIAYTWRKSREVGPVRLWKAMRSKNACKTCALGMGGQLGGMRNEAGRFPEICKKSLQAMVADMQGRIERRFFETYSVGQLQQMSPRELEHAGRITEPMILQSGDDRYRPISWEDAIARIASALHRTKPERAFLYSSGRSSNEAGFLLQLFARCYGTNHVSNCSYYCHQASGVGLTEAIGTGTATVRLEDLDRCDLVFLFGANPASNHPRLMTSLVQLRQRGGHVIVINPLRELGLERFRVPSDPRSLFFGSDVASLYLQPKIGGDIAFMAGVAKCLLESNSIDPEFIEAHTEGFEDLRELLNRTSWPEIIEQSGLEEREIRSAAELYKKSERALLAWTMGITHHLHGVENVQWIVNLALLRGMAGKPGAGLLPIRGHSNVQGLGTIGVTPQLSKAVLERLAKRGVHPPDWKGHDTLAALAAAHSGEMDFGLCLGGNLYGASPDAALSGSALGRLDTLVYLSTTLNTGHAHGLGKTTIILPILARDEEPESSTQESMFSYVRLSDGGPERHQGPRAETAVLASIADATLGSNGPAPWSDMGSHEALRAWIADIVPNMEQLSSIGADKKEFSIPGRTIHEPIFPTPSGRAKFAAHPIPAQPRLGPSQLRLMTIRSEGQFNTVVYEEEDLYRGQDRRDVILMHAKDIAKMGLAVNQPVTVRSEAGEMRGILVREFEIAPGCAAMYYPEANALVPSSADPRSRTPAFKSVVVEIDSSPKQPTAKRETIELKSTNKGSLKSC